VNEAGWQAKSFSSRRRTPLVNEATAGDTAAVRPWRPLVVIEFDDEEPALKFEAYLKTGSGREFARHFRQSVRQRDVE